MPETYTEVSERIRSEAARKLDSAKYDRTLHCGHRANCSRQYGGRSTMANEYSLAAYERFLRSKVCVSQDFGFSIELDEIHPWLKPHAKIAVQWAVTEPDAEEESGIPGESVA